MRLLVAVLTTLILAYLGQILVRAVWLTPLVIVGAVALGYAVGTDEDRQEFKVVGRKALTWMRSWGRGNRP